MLHWWAKQNNYFIVYISFLVLVTNAGRIHWTKNKKVDSWIFNYLCRHHRARIFVIKKTQKRRSPALYSRLYTLHPTPAALLLLLIAYSVCVRVRSSQRISRALVGKMRILSATAIISVSEG